MAIPRKNHSTPETPETTTTTNLVQPNVYSRLCQMSSSTSTTSLNPPNMENIIFLQSDGKSSHEAQCSKSRALNKDVDLIIGIE